MRRAAYFSSGEWNLTFSATAHFLMFFPSFQSSPAENRLVGIVESDENFALIVPDIDIGAVRHILRQLNSNLPGRVVWRTSSVAKASTKNLFWPLSKPKPNLRIWRGKDVRLQSAAEAKSNFARSTLNCPKSQADARPILSPKPVHSLSSR